MKRLFPWKTFLALQGIVLAALWITGIWLWWMPHAVRRRKRKGGGSVASGGVDG